METEFVDLMRWMGENFVAVVGSLGGTALAVACLRAFRGIAKNPYDIQSVSPPRHQPVDRQFTAPPVAVADQVGSRPRRVVVADIISGEQALAIVEFGRRFAKLDILVSAGEEQKPGVVK